MEFKRCWWIFEFEDFILGDNEFDLDEAYLRGEIDKILAQYSQTIGHFHGIKPDIDEYLYVASEHSVHW